MTRIIIEIDGKEVSSTAVQPTDSLGAPPPELLARALALGALDAGSAPSGIASFEAAVVAPAAVDAGPSREHAPTSEHAEDPKPKSKPK
jgi:hypothetical protein